MSYDDRTIQQVLQDDNRYLKEKIEQLKIIEPMQKVIHAAGGRFFGSDELLAMSMSEFISQFSPNNIEITIAYKGKTK